MLQSTSPPPLRADVADVGEVGLAAAEWVMLACSPVRFGEEVEVATTPVVEEPICPRLEVGDVLGCR